jgi:GNAT superfamily N-acetyltransferase
MKNLAIRIIFRQIPMANENSELIATTLLTSAQRSALIRLWNDEYPVQIALQGEEGLENYLRSIQNATHYFAEKNGEIVGWACAFDRDNERWFAIIVDSSAHRSGVGSNLLGCLQETNTALVGWAVDKVGYTRANGAHYSSPLLFYVHHGFHVLDERLEIPALSAVKISWQRNKDS